MSRVDDLVAWLRGCLDEDERVARPATPGPWWHNPGKQWLGPEEFERYDLTKGEEFVGHGGPHPFTGCVAATGPADHPQSMADAEHIARHDPARVLREIEAKRRHIGQYEAAVDLRDRAIAAYKRTGSQADTSQVIAYSAKVEALRFVLLDDAIAFVDRQGYQEVWKPA
jgi:hypothetical protein